MQYLRYFDRVPLARNGAPNVILKQNKHVLFLIAKTFLDAKFVLLIKTYFHQVLTSSEIGRLLYLSSS